MKRLNLGLLGASGKMGKAVQSLAVDFDFNLFIAVSRQTCDDFVFSVTKLQDIENDILEQVDVWIDFSSSQGLLELIKHTRQFKTPIISGTTGLPAVATKKLHKESTIRPIFWASNMSIGVWILRQAMKSLKSAVHFDFDIDETHHNQKKDNPSGTARTLHEDLKKIVHKQVSLSRGKRLGGIYGIHKVTAASQSEVITFEHTALNRTVFAEGAIKAARWIVNQKKGYYSMGDFLK